MSTPQKVQYVGTLAQFYELLEKDLSAIPAGSWTQLHFDTVHNVLLRYRDDFWDRLDQNFIDNYLQNPQTEYNAYFLRLQEAVFGLQILQNRPVVLHVPFAKAAKK
jgi:hypothetical protein